jgi:hypothetical protein
MSSFSLAAFARQRRRFVPRPRAVAVGELSDIDYVATLEGPVGLAMTLTGACGPVHLLLPSCRVKRSADACVEGARVIVEFVRNPDSGVIYSVHRVD